MSDEILNQDEIEKTNQKNKIVWWIRLLAVVAVVALLVLVVFVVYLIFVSCSGQKKDGSVVATVSITSSVRDKDTGIVRHWTSRSFGFAADDLSSVLGAEPVYYAIESDEYLTHEYVITNLGGSTLGWAISLSDTEIENFTVTYIVDGGEKRQIDEIGVMTGEVASESECKITIIITILDANGPANFTSKFNLTLATVGEA